MHSKSEQTLQHATGRWAKFMLAATALVLPGLAWAAGSAALAGPSIGAGSGVGDTTTTMMWIAGAHIDWTAVGVVSFSLMLAIFVNLMINIRFDAPAAMAVAA